MSLNTSIGGAESTSFSAIAWIEGYLEDVYGTLADSWTSLTEAQKEIRAEFGALIIGWLPLRGRRAYRNQRLPFPRDHQADPRTIPLEVYEAHALITYEVAHPALTKESTAPDSQISMPPIQSIDVGGVLQVMFSYSLQSLEKGGRLVRLISSDHPLIYSKMQRHLYVIRGRKIRNPSEVAYDEASLLTTST